jgi:hypothetical protein
MKPIRDSEKLSLGGSPNAEALLADLCERLRDGGEIATVDEYRAWRIEQQRLRAGQLIRWDDAPQAMQRFKALDDVRIHRGPVGAYIARLCAMNDCDRQEAGPAFDAAFAAQVIKWRDDESTVIRKWRLETVAADIPSWWGDTAEETT